jgi:hypothetical protein
MVLSPKRCRHSTENRPMWVKPQLIAISVTLCSGSARNSASRTLSNLLLRRYCIGDMP